MDAQYFIKKFTAIPSVKWNDYVQKTDNGSRCVYGWCCDTQDRDDQEGHYTEEGVAVREILEKIPNLTSAPGIKISPYSSTPARINNRHVAQYQQKNPKARVLAALRDAKKLGL